MDATVICSIITAIATVAVAVISKNNHNTDKAVEQQMQAINARISDMNAQMRENDLQTCRIDLRQMIIHSGDNIPAVLEIATRYFLDLGGNADMGGLFLWWVDDFEVEKWAIEHRWNIGPLMARVRYLES